MSSGYKGEEKGPMANIFQESEIVIPKTLPLLPVRDVVIFPYMFLPLFVGREGSIKAVEEALANNRIIFLVTQKDSLKEDPSPDDIYKVGVVATIVKMLKLPDGRGKILVQSLSKARIIKYTQTEPMMMVEIENIEEEEVTEISVEIEAMMRNIRKQCEKTLSLKGLISNEIMTILHNIEEPGKLADLVISNLDLKISEAQEILEISDPMQKLEKANKFLAKEFQVSSIQAKIQNQAKDEMTKTQREYFLREQLRAIQSELGEIDEQASEFKEFSEKIKKAKMPKDVAQEANKQLNRLEQMHPEAAETNIVRTYLEWLVELPWSKSTRDNINIQKASQVLDDDHYDLEKVKERLLEYLGVRKLKKKIKGPILCFVGPPGVGKTSLGKSIARALGRKFVRISLGGMRDEAEIRGHRRTYIGALPGRIIQGLKQAGTNNPVFMLDEIDKIGADFRGDPSAALLEALDPEQNFAFSDHYLNLPFDLSNVMFITTANLVDPILSALRDRMEVINLSGYTSEEKLYIARRFLLPRQVEENGIKNRDLQISDEAIFTIISQYTHEAGLRNLEREIASICRKIARKKAEGGKGTTRITKGNLHKFLGVPKHIPEVEQEKDKVGIATGLAWTQAGGEILYIEVSSLRGKGRLTLTGQLGDVMKESGQAALSYARSRAESWKLPGDFYEKMDIHIHVPAGAIPKDGPSAGVTMATALISCLAKIPVRKDVAMTGEITLQGRVLPVGGIKEKSLAALRAKITTLIIPEKNRKDLEEIPANIRRKLNFIFAENMDEILDAALVKQKKKHKKTTRKKS